MKYLPRYFHFIILLNSVTLVVYFLKFSQANIVSTFDIILLAELMMSTSREQKHSGKKMKEEIKQIFDRYIPHRANNVPNEPTQSNIRVADRNSIRFCTQFNLEQYIKDEVQRARVELEKYIDKRIKQATQQQAVDKRRQKYVQQSERKSNQRSLTRRKVYVGESDDECSPRTYTSVRRNLIITFNT